MDATRPDADGYELLDVGRGERLEQWGRWRLRRPDARAAAMARTLPAAEWDAADAWYRGDAGRGAWSASLAPWTITLDDLSFVIKLAPFKHTGLFPEQAVHWRWMRAAAARAGRRLRVLNLFAYTGGATIALAKDGHAVTHVDASKPALAWARENARLNALAADAVRWIQDDVPTFVRRERRRGREYDAVLLDPPAFGRAPKAGPRHGATATWQIDRDLPALLTDLSPLLVSPVFVLLNDYARDAHAPTLAHLLRTTLSPINAPATHVDAGRLTLHTRRPRSLDTGAYARWSSSPSTA